MRYFVDCLYVACCLSTNRLGANVAEWYASRLRSTFTKVVSALRQHALSRPSAVRSLPAPYFDFSRANSPNLCPISLPSLWHATGGHMMQSRVTVVVSHNNEF